MFCKTLARILNEGNAGDFNVIATNMPEGIRLTFVDGSYTILAQVLLPQSYTANDELDTDHD